MRNRILALLFWPVVFSCDIAMAQESTALTAREPIKLTKVEGRVFLLPRSIITRSK